MAKKKNKGGNGGNNAENNNNNNNGENKEENNNINNNEGNKEENNNNNNNHNGGEKKEENNKNNNNGGEKNNNGGDKKEENNKGKNNATVLKVYMHCEGCANKVTKHLNSIKGVDTVKAESETGKVTVTGNVDPTKLRDNLAEKIKKKVELISPLPKKDNNKKENEPNKKSDEKKNEDKKESITTSVLKLVLHCQGCIDKIGKIVMKTKGVLEMKVDKEKDNVIVKGTMDVKKLVENLSKKLKRKVEVVRPKKDKEGSGGGGEKEGNEGGGAEVMLECKQRNSNEVVFSKPGKTDATGEYTIYVDQDRADEVCDVKLINSPERSCSERALGRDQARVILTRYNGIASNDRFANAMLYMAEEVASGCAEVLKQMQELDEEN